MSKFAEYVPSEPQGKRLSPPEDLALRPATPVDTPRLAELVQQRNGGELAPILARMERELTSPGHGVTGLILVAETGGSVIGFGRATQHRRVAAASALAAPEGWYLLGLIVDPAMRRRGVGAELTRGRMRWVAERASEVFYFANARNLVTIDLHRALGFEEVTREFEFPGVVFEGGVGILFRAPLSSQPCPARPADV